jgi:hypothetical protein
MHPACTLELKIQKEWGRAFFVVFVDRPSRRASLPAHASKCNTTQLWEQKGRGKNTIESPIKWLLTAQCSARNSLFAV